MKKIGIALLALLSCLVCMGAGAVESPPVMASKNFYVTDYADIIFKEHRDELSGIANTLYRETGVQLVVLTVKDFSGMEIEEYASAILKGWKIESGGLILVNAGTNASTIAVTENLEQCFPPQLMDKPRAEILEPHFSSANYSTGIVNTYKDMTSSIYTGFGIVQTPEIAQQLDKQGGGFPGFLTVLVGVLAIVGLRSVMKSRRNRKKNIFRYNPTEYRRDFTRSTAKREDDYDINRVTMEPDAESHIRRSGFIIYRDTQQDHQQANKNQ